MLFNLKHIKLINKPPDMLYIGGNNFNIALNNKLEDVKLQYCLECTTVKKIEKLIHLYNLRSNIKTEQELYNKYNITINDLTLFAYLDIIQFIKNNNKSSKKFDSMIKNHITNDIYLIIHMCYIQI